LEFVARKKKKGEKEGRGGESVPYEEKKEEGRLHRAYGYVFCVYLLAGAAFKPKKKKKGGDPSVGEEKKGDRGVERPSLKKLHLSTYFSRSAPGHQRRRKKRGKRVGMRKGKEEKKGTWYRP